MIKWGYILLFTLGSLFAWAGDKVKNGGDVVICPNAKGTSSYELLDLVEARMPQPATFNIIGDENKTFEQALNFIFKRIEKFNPTRAQLYREWAKLLSQESSSIKGAKFTDLLDEGEGKIYPKNCELSQVVLQYRKPDFRGIRYLINADIWEKMTPFQQAATVVHEFLYRELTTDNRFVSDSSGVRIFNAYLHSTEFNQSHLQDYVQLLRVLGVQKTDVNGYVILLNSGDRYLAQSENYPISFFDADRVMFAFMGPVLKINNEMQTQINCMNSHDNIRITFGSTDKSARLSGCMMRVGLDSSFQSNVAIADFVNLENPVQISSLKLVNWDLVDWPQTLMYTKSQYHFEKSGELNVQFWPSGVVKMIKRWGIADDLSKSYFLVEDKKILLSDVKKDRICFNEQSEISWGCEDHSEDWF